jgi:hypothetical protein
MDRARGGAGHELVMFGWFVEEAVTALGYSTELAHHLFRECWVMGTGSDTDLCRGRLVERKRGAF